MNTQARNLFPGVLAVIALIGVGLIFVSRGQNTDGATSSLAATANKTFKLTIDGQEQEIIGEPFSGDAVGQAQSDADAGYALKIEGTPSFFINGYRYDAALPIEALCAILKDAGIE